MMPRLDVLITIPLAVSLALVRQLHRPLAAAISASGVRPLGVCVDCGDPVREGDAFLRYRGDYYHASPCVELNPPAVRSPPVRHEGGAE